MRRPLPLPLVGPAIVLVVGLLALAGGYVSAGANDPPERATLSDPPPQHLRGVVQSVSSDSLTLATDGGQRSLRLLPETQVEALRPSSVGAIRPGDWANAGALPHRQTVFAITGLVLLPQGSFTPPR